jgi:hypothetical protein
VCQPHLGASLRKGWFRMIGTLVGAVAIVVLTACFPQERAAFLIGLALWGAACAFVATLLRNFAAYAAALAGYTAAIIANDQLGATGGPNGDAFMLAIFRGSEICIGIVCAGIVLAGTDFGGAPRRLAARFAALSDEIANRFRSTLVLAASPSSDAQSVRHELIRQQPIRRELYRQVIALAPVVDEAMGESSRACWPRSALGAWSRRGYGGCRRRPLGRRSLPCCSIFHRSCGPPPNKPSRTAGRGTRSACSACLTRQLGY